MAAKPKKPFKLSDFPKGDRRKGFNYVCMGLAAANPKWGYDRIVSEAKIAMTAPIRPDEPLIELKLETRPIGLDDLVKIHAAEEEKPKTIFKQAEDVIYGDREKTYGSPDKNLTAIADFWNAYQKNKFAADFKLNVDDICLMMDLLKTARLINSPTHFDSMMDKIGYVGLMDRVQKHQGRA